LAIATGLIAWARQWWKGRSNKRAWRSGPNAQWQQGQERGPRQVSDAELMRAMMMQQMMANSGGRGQRPTPNTVPNDDDLMIDF
jgi:hypothetical protein